MYVIMKGDWTVLNDLNQDKYILLDNDECEVDQIHIWFCTWNLLKELSTLREKKKRFNYLKICAVNNYFLFIIYFYNEKVYVTFNCKESISDTE